MSASDVTDQSAGSRAPLGGGRRLLNKVPEITALFWVIKILTTGMGEAAADYLDHQLDPAVAVGAAGLLLAAALGVQLWSGRYRAPAYWSAVVMVSVFGTMVADGFRRALGLSHLANTAFFVVGLAAVFALWFLVERTLSIHTIRTRRRELFYWAAVMGTFALGTAAGDWTALALGWGFLASGVLFTVVMLLPWAAHRRAGLGAVPAFWFAYILTRPVGASFADWMAVPRQVGGLGWGTGPVSLGLTGLILLLVAVLAVTRRDVAAAPDGA